MGYIEKGNTHIIAEETGADSFEIVRVTPYTKEYDACTHEGSGISGTGIPLKGKLSGANVLDGIAIMRTTAQNDRESAKSAVLEWLEKLDLSA